MSDAGMLEDFLAGGCVDAAVFALRPDYRAMLLAANGLVPGPSDQHSDGLLQAAETAAREGLRGRPAEELPHVAAWREAYRAFGAKPQRTRNSLEALLRRAASGLPRVNRLTDFYNAVSVLHQIPLGGEDLTRYADPPRLVRAAGTEPFDTVADGIAVIERPDPGEVVWCDDAGVTCRRWNWRQARRTQLREDTTAALFILDALDPVTDGALHAAADDLAALLARLGPDVRAVRRLITAGDPPGPAVPDSADWQRRWTLDAGSVTLRPVTRRLAHDVLDGGPITRTFEEGSLHDRIPQAMGVAIRDIDSGTAAVLPTVWLIVRRTDGRILGDLGTHGPPDSEGCVEIGYSLAPSARGQGIGTAAVAAFVGRLAEEPGIRRLTAVTGAQNTASRRLLERQGFHFTGRLPGTDEVRYTRNLSSPVS